MPTTTDLPPPSPVSVGARTGFGGSLRHRYGLVLVVVDLLMISLALVAAARLRAALPLPLTRGDLDRFLIPVLPTLAGLWLAALVLMGAYRRRHWGAGLDEYRQVATASLAFVMGLGLLAFIFDYPLSRAFVALLPIISIPLLCLGRLIARRVLQALRVRGHQCTPTLIAGHAESVADLVDILQRERWLGYTPVAVALDHDDDRDELAGLPRVGTASDIIPAIDASRASTVIFTNGSFRRGSEFNQFAHQLQLHDTEMIVVPALSDVASQRIAVTPVAGLPLMHVTKPRGHRSLRPTKRLFDIIASCLLLVLFSPLLVLVAIAITLEDRGPVLFHQRRVGRLGATFDLLKFRSMVIDAEPIRDRDLQHLNEADGRLFKMKSDPRVTRVGRLIRRYSIDELPQLVNVIRGEMSLVGPRPALPDEVASYKAHIRRRLDIRPGLTGLWQVSGRSDLSWDDAVRLDLYYVDNWSLLQDLVILLRTLKAVLTSRGAY